jgi:hypothetical protein
LRASERYTLATEPLAAQGAQMRESPPGGTAAGLGRLPNIVADILLGLAAARMTHDFCVIGTHAIHGFEAMAGVHCRMALLASGDVDLLYDPRRRISLVTRKLDEYGLLGLLKKVAPTFTPLRESPFRAANDKGFMVDLVIPARDIRDTAVMSFGQGDLIAVEVPNLHWLVNAPKHEVVAIAADGRPVMMRVPDPRAFALHKAWLSTRKDREPVKKARDKAQAALVAEMVLSYLPALDFDPAALRYFSANMLASAQQTLRDEADIRLPGLDL